MAGSSGGGERAPLADARRLAAAACGAGGEPRACSMCQGTAPLATRAAGSRASAWRARGGGRRLPPCGTASGPCLLQSSGPWPLRISSGQPASMREGGARIARCRADRSAVAPPAAPLSLPQSVQTFGRKKNAVAVAYVKRGKGELRLNGERGVLRGAWQQQQQQQRCRQCELWGGSRSRPGAAEWQAGAQGWQRREHGGSTCGARLQRQRVCRRRNLRRVADSVEHVQQRQAAAAGGLCSMAAAA